MSKSQICVLGIDPGKQGAIALLCNDPYTTDFWLMRDIEENRTSLEAIIRCDKRDYQVDHVFIEKAQAFPGMSSVHSFQYAVNFGKLLGTLEQLGTPYTMIPPQTWTKAMHLGCTGKTPKEKSSQAVKRLFPKENLRNITENVRLLEGLVDSLLIAEFGRRCYVKC